MKIIKKILQFLDNTVVEAPQPIEKPNSVIGDVEWKTGSGVIRVVFVMNDLTCEVKAVAGIDMGFSKTQNIYNILRKGHKLEAQVAWAIFINNFPEIQTLRYKWI